VLCDNQRYLIKQYFNPDAACIAGDAILYEILLYKEDDATIWSEKVNVERFQEKWREYNPKTEMKAALTSAQVQSALQEISGQQKQTRSKLMISTKDTEEVKLTLKSKFTGAPGLPYLWTFVCTPCLQKHVQDLLVDPLFVIVHRLHSQREQLLDVIEQKEREIEDYREQGYVPSRKNIVTEPFTRNMFLGGEDFAGVSSSESLAISEVKEMYVDIMRGKGNVNQQEHRPQSGVAGEFVCGGNASVDGDFVVKEACELDSSGVDHESEVTRKTAEEEEKERREEIRKRLAKEHERKTKKKKKLNL